MDRDPRIKLLVNLFRLALVMGTLRLSHPLVLLLSVFFGHHFGVHRSLRGLFDPMPLHRFSQALRNAGGASALETALGQGHQGLDGGHATGAEYASRVNITVTQARELSRL